MKYISKPILGTQLNWAHPLNKGLAGFWLFNEGMGDKVNDLSMNGNIGPLTGMAFPSTPASGWNPGRNGVGLNFDGVNDYVNVGNGASLNITDTITVSAWIKLNSLSSGYGTVVGKWATAVGRKDYIVQTNNNKLEFWYTADGTTTDYIVSNTTLTTGWTHVVAVKGSDNIVRQYINGIADSVTDSLTAIHSFTQDTYVGKWSGGEFFNGSIDEVRIYNRALSANEIMELYINLYGVFL